LGTKAEKRNGTLTRAFSALRPGVTNHIRKVHVYQTPDGRNFCKSKNDYFAKKSKKNHDALVRWRYFARYFYRMREKRPNI